MRFELDSLLTEQVNQDTVGIDNMPTEELLRVINHEDKKVAYAVAEEIPQIAAAVDKIVAAFQNGGRLIYLGAGTSGRLGVLDAAECMPTFGVKSGMVIGLIAGGEAALTQAVEGAEDQTQEVVTQLQAINLQAGDVVVGLAASGRTPYVIAGLAYARKTGACTVAVSCTPASMASRVAEIDITPLVGPEVITGSTRMKAGTAEKLVLNMLSTAAMIRLGKVYGNLMVDVQPTNGKLLERAKRIVAAATGLDKESAGEVLAQAGQNPKTAIIMIKRSCSANQAGKYLAAAGGFISRALTINEKEIEGSMKILLVCSGGMSSAIVVKAIEKEAAKAGLVYEVKSVGSGEFAEEIKHGWDVALVAPQVRHRFAFFQEAAAEYHVPVAVIPPQGYSPMGGAVIMAEIKRLLD